MLQMNQTIWLVRSMKVYQLHSNSIVEKVHSATWNLGIPLFPTQIEISKWCLDPKLLFFETSGFFSLDLIIIQCKLIVNLSFLPASVRFYLQFFGTMKELSFILSVYAVLEWKSASIIMKICYHLTFIFDCVLSDTDVLPIKLVVVMGF